VGGRTPGRRWVVGTLGDIGPTLAIVLAGDEGTDVEAQLPIMERHRCKEETDYTRFPIAPSPITMAVPAASFAPTPTTRSASSVNGYEQADLRERFKEQPLVAFLDKPYSTKQLREALATLGIGTGQQPPDVEQKSLD
jgi:hypothetical protein